MIDYTVVAGASRVRPRESLVGSSGTSRIGQTQMSGATRPRQVRSFTSDARTATAPTRHVWALLVSPDGRFALSQPVRLEVTDADRDGIYVASDSFSISYGAGETPAESIQDYAANVFADFEELEEDEEALGPALKRELATLRRYITRR